MWIIFYMVLKPTYKGINLGDNCIQNVHLGRYIVTYMVGNFVLRRRVSRAVKHNFRPHNRQYISPNEHFEYGYPHSNALFNIYSSKAQHFAPKWSFVSNVKQLCQPITSDVTYDVGALTVYPTLYWHKFLTLSNKTSRYIRKCIRIILLKLHRNEVFIFKMQCSGDSHHASNWFDLCSFIKKYCRQCCTFQMLPGDQKRSASAPRFACCEDDQEDYVDVNTLKMPKLDNISNGENTAIEMTDRNNTQISLGDHDTNSEQNLHVHPEPNFNDQLQDTTSQNETGTFTGTEEATLTNCHTSVTTHRPKITRTKTTKKSSVRKTKKALQNTFRTKSQRKTMGTVKMPPNMSHETLGQLSGLSKKISNDQELIQSDPISCTQNQKGNN